MFHQVLLRSDPSSDVRILHEVTTENGIPDVVLTSLAVHCESASALLADIPPRLAFLFGPERDSSFPTEFDLPTFSRATGMSAASASRTLRGLVDAGAVQALTNCRGSYRRLVLEDPFQWIVSVEAKLAKWEHALGQAYRYREYSNQSWVLLDAARSEPALKALTNFKTASVGLALLDCDCELYIAYEPPLAPPLSNNRRWAAAARFQRHFRQRPLGTDEGVKRF